jgi:hypothetical protein
VIEQKWYFVEDGQRKGPISKDEILKLIEVRKLDSSSYVWTKGFEDWRKLEEVEELKVEPQAPKVKFDEMPPLNLTNIDPHKKVIYIKTGLDRGTKSEEFGPFNLQMLKKLYHSKRINGKTLVFFPGLDVWKILASFEDFQTIFEDIPPVIEEHDKRIWERKPFMARLFFTNKDQFFEGICRDISLGGMKVLIDHFPAKLNEEISLNVHPEQEEYQFVAKAKVVRVLDDDNGFSLEFVDLGNEAKSAISSYLATR